MSTHEFDFCALGAGSGGFAAATIARGMGKTVALVDGTAPLGGLCILRGCMPSKTLLRSAEIAHLAATAGEVGVQVDSVVPNVRAIVERKRLVIEGFADYRKEGIKEFPLFRGAPRFTGRNELSVGDDIIRARKFLVSTGSVINVPEIPGLREIGFVTSDDLLEMETLPKSVVTLGGGPVAVELAQYLARMGCSVSMVQRSKTLLSFEDADVGEALGEALAGDGIRLTTGATVKRIERAGTSKRVIAQQGPEEVAFGADEIFLALGRRPKVDGFGFEAAGIAFDKAGIKVNEYLQTSNPDIYAAGDVCSWWQLVHVAVYEGELAAHNAFGDRQRAAAHDAWRARAVFTDPQVAVAGLSERECRERGIAYETASYAFADLGKGIAANLTQGFIKMLAAPDGTLLGVAIVGAEASDLIHESIALLHFNANVCDVMDMPHLHPTLAEIITYPAEELCERLKREAHALVRP